MDKNDNYRGISVIIQGQHVSITAEEKQSVYEMIDKLLHHNHTISFANVHFKSAHTNASNEMAVLVKLGLPGKDAFAEASALHWKTALHEVTDKLNQQLSKLKH